MLGRAACQNPECMDDRGIPIHDDGIVECESCGRKHTVVIDADGGHTDVTITLTPIECPTCRGDAELWDPAVGYVGLCPTCDGAGEIQEEAA